MRVTFEFPDDVMPCAVWLNYVVYDSTGQMQIGVRCAGTEEIQKLKAMKNAALRVVVGEACNAGIVEDNDK